MAMPSPVDSARVGGDGEALPRATRRDDDVAGPHASLGAGGSRSRAHRRRGRPRRSRSEPSQPSRMSAPDAWTATDERALDLGAGGVTAGVHDARRRSDRPLACERSRRDPSTRSKWAPSAMSSRTRVGPSLASTRTASVSQRPPPAASVSEPCSSGESSSCRARRPPRPARTGSPTSRARPW